MDNVTIKNPARRKFLRTVPVAAAAGFVLGDAMLFNSDAAAQGAVPVPAAPYKLISAAELAGDIAAEGQKGNKTLFDDRNFNIVLTTETATAGKEFEWHEERDHIFYVFDGSTSLELGGTPQNAHSTGPGEWLAPASVGAATVTLNKGDTLIIPRGTPHKRTTTGSATFTLTAPRTPRMGGRMGRMRPRA